MTVHEVLSGSPPGVMRRDAETLLMHVLGRNRAWLIAHPEAGVAPGAEAAFQALLVRRAAGEPVQHLTGTQEFFGLDLRVTPDVLIPRPETEHVVETILAWVADRKVQENETSPQEDETPPQENETPPQAHVLRLLDVGTGSGAIALALAATLPAARITALDISEAALVVARENAERLGLNEQVRFLRSDLLKALRPEMEVGLRFDAIGSNPPYIALKDRQKLATEVRDHEPALALFAGEEGMDVYRRLVPEAAAALRSGGLLAMELGYGQQELIEELFRVQPRGVWAGLEFLPDLRGIPRVARAVRA